MMELDTVKFKKAIRKGRILVCFGAEWCPPCREMKRRLEGVKGCRAGYVDITGNMALAKAYEAFKLPLTVLFDGGHEVKRAVGLFEDINGFVKR